MAKQLQYSDEGRRSILVGVEKLARAVKATLGPKGRNVAIERSFGIPTITKDGVTVAKEIELEDPFENMGADMVKEVASKTSDIAGDGTTTAIVLAEAIYKEGLKNVASGANPMQLKKGIEKATEAVVEELKKMSIEVKDIEEITQIATIASNNDKFIGSLIAEAMSKVGRNGVIQIEEGNTLETNLKIVEGMQFDKGYLSPYFISDAVRMECVLEDPYILICTKRISNFNHLVPILEKIAQDGKPLLIIADDVDGEALSTLIVNNLRGSFVNCSVKAPGYGNIKKNMLEDIAILTGGTLINEDIGVKLKDITAKDLGQAKKVTISKDNTTIVEGRGSDDSIQERIQQITNEIENSDSVFDKEKLSERLAKLSGGVAIINVGAATEAEMKEKKSRIEDALHATRAASEEGIIPGGGVALLKASTKLDDIKLSVDGDEKIGIDIIKSALTKPASTIASNAGQTGEVIVARLLSGNKKNEGYNANTDTYVDMIATGIIDPTKVARSAIQNAASIASLLIITEVIICNKPDSNKTEDEGV